MLSGGCQTSGNIINTVKLYFNFATGCSELPTFMAGLPPSILTDVYLFISPLLQLLVHQMLIFNNSFGTS